jgi:hypothetical protein
MVVTLADVPDWGNHTDWPLHKFCKALIAMGLREKFLLARRVFWGAAVWNFRYFRDRFDRHGMGNAGLLAARAFLV